MLNTSTATRFGLFLNCPQPRASSALRLASLFRIATGFGGRFPAPKHRYLLGWLWALVLLSGSLRAQSIDPNFPAESGFNTGTGVNGLVRSVALQGNGKVLIGGQFTNFNGTSRNNIARLNADGSLDTSFNPGTGANGRVERVVIQADGKILIGGVFTSYNGIGRNRIARLNADGSLDTDFNPGTGANNMVISIVVQGDGKILIGGGFSTYNDTGRNSIARLNSDGSLDTGFNPGTGASGPVYSIVAQGDNKILIGGLFATYNGTPRNNIARLNADGSLDTSFTPGTGANNTVISVVRQGDGKILIGGIFNLYNGTSRSGIARLNADGSLDTSFNPGTGTNDNVYSVVIQGDGKVLIGGQFVSYNGTSRSGIARLNSDGSLDTGFDPGTGTNSFVNSVLVQGDGKILIGGDFTTYNGIGRNRTARLNANGSLHIDYAPGTGANSYVRSVALQGDGKIVIGGAFFSYNGKALNRVARLNSNGSPDTGFNSGAGTNNPVWIVAVQEDGKVLIGGFFASYNGTPRNNITRLNADGSLDTGFNPGGAGANGFVRSMVVQGDGKILIGGDFNSYNGTTCNHIARLNADGSLDTDFNPGGVGANHIITSIVLQGDDKILIGGYFSLYDGIGNSRNRIARLNADGSLDASFNPRVGANNGVECLAIQGDGKVLMGGNFTSVGGTSRNGIARLNADGSLDTGFDPGAGAAGANGNVISVAVQGDGKILIGGWFTTYNGNSRNGIARLNADGSLDTGFDPGTGFAGGNRNLQSIMLQGDGKILIVGDFTSYNGSPRNNIARLLPPPAMLTGLSASQASVCSGVPVSFTATLSDLTGPYTYTLSNGLTSISGSASTPTFSQTWTASGSGTQPFTLSVTAGTASLTATTSLEVYATPVVSLSASSPLTCTATSVTLTASASGSALSYSFSAGASALSSPGQASVSSEGLYSVTVTNGNGCSATTSVQVNQDISTPSVSISPSLGTPAGTTLTCSNPVVSLSAVGNGTYRWSTGATTSSISVSTATTYSVTLTGANGCTASASVQVSSDQTPLPISINPLSATLTCAMLSTTLTAQGIGTYHWNTGATTSSISVSVANTYSVTLTGANGCTSAASTTVSVDNTPPLISINSSSGAPTGTTLTCTTPTVSLSAVGSGTYRWSTGATTSSISVSVADTYSVTLTGANGCTAFASTTISVDKNPPPISTNPASATLTCSNPVVSLSAVGSGTYHWNTGATTSSISVSMADTYSVTLTGANGCTASASAQVNSDQSPPSISINVVSTTLTCSSPTASLSAVGVGTYRWSTGATTSSISVSTATTYSVTLTGTNGCTSTASTSVSLNNTPPPISINPTSATLNCTTSSVSLSAVGVGTYRWSTGATTSSISVSTATTYSVTLTGANGCTSTASANVTYQNCAPTVANAIPSKSATLGEVFSYTIPATTFTDAETPNSLTLSVSGLPAGLSFVSPNIITGVASTTIGSPFNVTVTATDPGGLSVATSFALSVQPRGFAITGVTMLDCNHLSYYQRRINFTVSFEAINGQPISLSVVNEVPAIPIPEPYQLTLFTDNPVIVFKASQQGIPGEATFSYNWLAHCANGDPRVENSIPPVSATVGQAFSYPIPATTFTDAETPNSLSLSVVGLPAGLSLVSPNLITGVVSASASSFYSVTVIAHDADGGSVSTLWPLSVVNGGGCASMYSVKAGDWSDGSVWSCGRVPVSTDVVTLHHAVSLPASYVGHSLLVLYSPTGRLLMGTSSRLRLGGN